MLSSIGTFHCYHQLISFIAQYYSFSWTRIHSVSCCIQRVTLRTGRNVRGGCGAITTDCPFTFALLTEPHDGHCTASTVDSRQRAISSLIGPEKEQFVDGPTLC